MKITKKEVNSMNNFQFASIFSNKRKEMNATQEDIAQYAGVSRAAVSKWEKGLSYPDILLLPKLAAYFNVSIDELLGYEPQMTEQRILETYATLAQAFATKPFEEVDKEIDTLLTEYYSCFPLILKMAQLYVNYSDVATNKAVLLEKVLALCIRVKLHSGDYKLANEALMLESLVYIMKGDAKQVLELLGEDVSIKLGVEELVATAQKMLGNTDKAKEILQVNMYQQLLSVVSNASETILLEIDHPAYFDETVRRINVLLETFELNKLNANTALVFYIKAASGYAMQQRLDDAFVCIENYVKTCMSITFPIRLQGDNFFYLLENWIEREVLLSSQAPSDDQTIKKALYESVAKNPLFAALQMDTRYQLVLRNLKHYLRLREE